MGLSVLIGVAFAVLFYRAAEYEHLSPFTWVLASIALTLAVGATGRGPIATILVQVALFGVMWWYNAFRKR